jgi:hypothetical protein
MDNKTRIERVCLIGYLGVAFLVSLTLCGIASAQESQVNPVEEFGPVVRAYLGYLDDEQEVVDDRASRHEISVKYYRRNSNRIRALRKIAINIAHETNNDYLPELEAAARDELKTLFETPPDPRSFKVGDVLNNTYRYLGTIRTGELFYVFARLNPYEQVEHMESGNANSPSDTNHSSPEVPVVTTNPEHAKTVCDTAGTP